MHVNENNSDKNRNSDREIIQPDVKENNDDKKEAKPCGDSMNLSKDTYEEDVIDNVREENGEEKKDNMSDDDLDLNENNEKCVNDGQIVNSDESVECNKNSLYDDRSDSKTIYSVKSEVEYDEPLDNENTIVSSLDEACSQVEDEMMDEGTSGELDDISLDGSPLADVDSQGERITEKTGRGFKIVRRRMKKVVPNYKAAKKAHENKKLKASQ